MRQAAEHSRQEQAARDAGNAAAARVDSREQGAERQAKVLIFLPERYTSTLYFLGYLPL